MTRLLDLDPQWVADYDGVVRSMFRGTVVLTIDTAQGVLFECPKCGAHSILAWFRGRGVPDDATPGPGRWTPSGTGFGDLTLKPSIDLSGGNPTSCQWHGFVTNGDAA